MLFPEIEKTVQSFDFNKISDDRKAVLQPLIEYIQNKVNNQEQINLHFICTHNSRRSHLSQIWAQAGAAYYKTGLLLLWRYRRNSYASNDYCCLKNIRF